MLLKLAPVSIAIVRNTGLPLLPFKAMFIGIKFRLGLSGYLDIGIEGRGVSFGKIVLGVSDKNGILGVILGYLFVNRRPVRAVVYEPARNRVGVSRALYPNKQPLISEILPNLLDRFNLHFGSSSRSIYSPFPAGSQGVFAIDAVSSPARDIGTVELVKLSIVSPEFHSNLLKPASSPARRHLLDIKPPEILQRYTADTQAHVKNMMGIALRIAEEIEVLSSMDKAVKFLKYACLIHDLGHIIRYHYFEEFIAFAQMVRSQPIDSRPEPFLFGPTGIFARVEAFRGTPLTPEEKAQPVKLYMELLRHIFGQGFNIPEPVVAAVLNHGQISLDKLTEWEIDYPPDIGLLVAGHQDYQIFAQRLPYASQLELDPATLKLLAAIIIVSDVADSGSSYQKLVVLRQVPLETFAQTCDCIKTRYKREDIEDLRPFEILRGLQRRRDERLYQIIFEARQADPADPAALQAFEAGEDNSSSPAKRYKGLKPYGILSRTFIKNVRVALRLGPDGSSEALSEIASKPVAFIYYDQNMGIYRLVNESECRRFIERAIQAGYARARYIMKGLLWEALLMNYVDFNAGILAGGRWTQNVYDLLIKASPFGQNFAKEFGLKLPRNADDPAIVDFSHNLFAKFLLFKVLPSAHLDSDLFGFHVFKDFEIEIVKTFQWFSRVGGVPLSEHFLSLFSSEEGADVVRKMQRQALAALKREQSPVIFVGSQMNEEQILRRTLRLNNQHSLLKALIFSPVDGRGFALTEYSLKDLETMGGAKVIDLSRSWGRQDEQLFVIQCLSKFARKAKQTFEQADLQGYQSILFCDLEISPYGSMDTARIILEVFSSMDSNSSRNLRKLIFVFSYDPLRLIKYWEGRKPPLAPVDLKAGDIVQIFTPFGPKGRAVLFGASDKRVKLLPVPAWTDTVLGRHDFKTSRRLGKLVAYAFSSLASLGLRIEREPVQTADESGNKVKIGVGEKFQIQIKGETHNCTVTGVAHWNFCLVCDAKVGEGAGFEEYALGVHILKAEQMRDNGELKKIDAWEAVTPASSPASAEGRVEASEIPAAESRQASSPAVTPINTDSKAMNTDKLACSMKLEACSTNSSPAGSFSQDYIAQNLQRLLATHPLFMTGDPFYKEFLNRLNQSHTNYFHRELAQVWYCLPCILYFGAMSEYGIPAMQKLLLTFVVEVMLDGAKPEKLAYYLRQFSGLGFTDFEYRAEYRFVAQEILKKIKPLVFDLLTAIMIEQPLGTPSFKTVSTVHTPQGAREILVSPSQQQTTYLLLDREPTLKDYREFAGIADTTGIRMVIIKSGRDWAVAKIDDNLHNDNQPGDLNIVCRVYPAASPFPSAPYPDLYNLTSFVHHPQFNIVVSQSGIVTFGLEVEGIVSGILPWPQNMDLRIEEFLQDAAINKGRIISALEFFHEIFGADDSSSPVTEKAPASSPTVKGEAMARPLCAAASPAIIEADARALCATYGKLSQVPAAFWEWLASLGAGYIWLKCPWARSRRSYWLMQHFSKAAGEKGIKRLASGYDVADYVVDPQIGTAAEFKKVSVLLKTMGIKVMSDLVTNHIAADSGLITRVPGLAITHDEQSFHNAAKRYYPEDTNGRAFSRLRKSGIILQHARISPFDCPMINLAQIKFWDSRARDFMIKKVLRIIADLTLNGGIRADLAYLALKQHIYATWIYALGISWEEFEEKLMPRDFWEEFMQAKNKISPEMLVAAETYEVEDKDGHPWDGRAGALQRFGLKTYDKHPYDLLVQGKVVDLINFIKAAPADFIRNSIYFTENHDEPPAAEAFGSLARALAATVILSLLPAEMLIPLRQLYDMRTPAGVIKAMKSPDAGIYAYQYPPDISQANSYLAELLGFLKQPVFQKGEFCFAEVAGVRDAAGQELPFDDGGIFPVLRHLNGERALGVVNYSPAMRIVTINTQGNFGDLGQRLSGSCLDSIIDGRLSVTLLPWSYCLFRFGSSSSPAVTARKLNKELSRVVKALSQDYIFSFQMEWGAGIRLLCALKDCLEKHLLEKSESRKRLDRLRIKLTAIRMVTEFARMLIAGGLGTFKRDLINSFYKIFASRLPFNEASKRISSFGVLYKGRIRGEEWITPDSLIFECLLEILGQPIKTYSIDLGKQLWQGGEREFNNIEVQIHRNPFSSFGEYLLYAPNSEIWDIIYPGNPDDDRRAVQSLLYRNVCLQFIVDLYDAGEITVDISFLASEVNTTLVHPAVIADKFKNHPAFRKLKFYHYNHTAVAAGIHFYCAHLASYLKLAEEFKMVIHDGIIDLVKLTGMISNIITGCSKKHTQVLRETIFKEFAAKVVEDDFFGNSEGSDMERWQGREIKKVIQKYSEEFGIDKNNLFYPHLLFARLKQEPEAKARFIQEIKRAKARQKSRFFRFLGRGVFSTNIPKDIIKEMKSGILFTMVRRLVPYKCSSWLLKLLDFAGKGVFALGGRLFGPFSNSIKNWIEYLRHLAPAVGHLVPIFNHNNFTSWLIQQASYFTMMLSMLDENKAGQEGGPTSSTNAGQNYAVLIAVLDGSIPEITGDIEWIDGVGICKVGFIVRHSDTLAEEDYAGEKLKGYPPDLGSLKKALQMACKIY
ncbi:MAG: alpha-amylase family glycosyl hydrolase, partial [Candidatus Omnitrophota bacterium]